MISKDKTYRTRDGREVRIYATDGVGCAAVHGAILQHGDGYGVTSGRAGMEWGVTVWDSEGNHIKSDFDLIEVKPRHKRTMWLNVYDNEVISLFISKEKADSLALTGRIACIKIDLDFEEGEGLR